MKIGIVSDSHGNAQRLRAALGIFNQRGVKTVIHCGDVGTSECVAILGTAQAAVYLVAGNTDRNIDQLEMAARTNNIHFAWEVAMVPLDGDRSLAATHGHDEQILGELILDQQFAYICHGHSHRLRDDRIGKSRVINCGALQRTSRPTVAVLDTASDKLEILDVPDGPGNTTGRKSKTLASECADGQ